MRVFFSRLGKCFALTVFISMFLMAVLFFALKRGITIDQYTLGDIVVKQCHLGLGKKLQATFGDITVSSNLDNRLTAYDPSTFWKVRIFIDLAVRYFDVIRIKKITIGKTTGTFSLNSDGTGGFTVHNPAYSLEGTLTYSKSFLTVDIQQFKSFFYRIQGNGILHMDIARKKFAGDIKVQVAKILPLDLHVAGDGYQVSFVGKGTAVVNNIRPIVEIFDLGPDIQPWITDSLVGKSFSLDLIKGTVPFRAPENVLRTLYGKVSIQGCKYTFEPKLPAITAQSTEVIFENGVLKIYPHRPAFAGVDAGRSWLDIDFNSEEPVLNAFFRTETGLGDEVLNLLNFYDINLPFKQTRGVTDADLTLSINLVSLKVGAKGNFKVTNGIFLYRQMPYTVTDSTILLSDDKVTLQELNIDYQDMAKLKVDGKIDFGAEKADLNIAAEKFDLLWQEKTLSLDVPKKKVLFHYKQNGDTKIFTAPDSNWNIGNIPVKIQGFTASIHAGDLSGKLADIHIDIPSYCKLLLSGTFNLTLPTFKFVADIQGWDSGSIKLDQKHVSLQLSYAQGVDIATDQESQWLIKGVKIHVSPFRLKYTDKKLAIEQLGLQYKNILDGKLHGVFDISKEQGYFILDQITIQKPGVDLPDFSGKNLLLELALHDGTISAAIPHLGLSYQRNEVSGWIVHIDALKKFYNYSDFLQKYNLNRGSIDIWQASNAPLMFAGKITYPYAFLVKNNTPMNTFDFKGQYGNGSLDAIINDDLHLHYSDRIQISSTGIGYNFSAIRSYLEEHIGSGGDQSNDDIPDFDLQADKTALFLNPSQSAPADQLQIHSENGTLTGRLRYGKGKAELQMNNVNFTLLGQDFGEKFLDGILKDSQVIGGKLSFYVSGLLTKFKGVMKIENSVIKNGAILNNIMAFISTVPDLITFSLPGYSLQGMPFRQLYAGFLYDNHTIDITTFAVESNALDMTGTGKINLVKNSINMNIDLISKTKKYVSKIPLLGYLLVGDTKQPTITLNVEGKLDNPDVSTSVYKEIVKTPFDILLRTISLPSHILEQLEGIGGKNSSQTGKKIKKNENP